MLDRPVGNTPRDETCTTLVSLNPCAADVMSNPEELLAVKVLCEVPPVAIAQCHIVPSPEWHASRSFPMLSRLQTAAKLSL